MYIHFNELEKSSIWDFPVVHWLRIHTFTAGVSGLNPGWGTKILHAVRCSQKKKKIIKLTRKPCASLSADPAAI